MTQEMSAVALVTNESRRNQRRRVIKGGVVLRGITESEIRVTVVNLAENGARLRVEPETMLPEEFLLYIRQDNVCYRAELRWRKDSLAGVEFTGHAEKPHWHLA